MEDTVKSLRERVLKIEHNTLVEFLIDFEKRDKNLIKCKNNPS